MEAICLPDYLAKSKYWKYAQRALETLQRSTFLLKLAESHQG